MSLYWANTSINKSRSFTCGHCGRQLASNIAFHRGQYEEGNGGMPNAFIYICHHCLKPTYFDTDGTQIPGVRFGRDVAGIDDDGVNTLYNEARDAYSKNAYTAAVLACRKLLMHIAVTKGASVGKNFIDYVEYLSQKGYVPPDAKDWVDHIRTKGNEANHEIIIMSDEEARDLLTFVEMLLQLIFEFPATSKKYTKVIET